MPVMTEAEERETIGARLHLESLGLPADDMDDREVRRWRAVADRLRDGRAHDGIEVTPGIFAYRGGSRGFYALNSRRGPSGSRRGPSWRRAPGLAHDGTWQHLDGADPRGWFPDLGEFLAALIPAARAVEADDGATP